MKILAFVISMLAAVFGVKAQTDTVISLVTCYPGADIYELEGHTAIRIDMGPSRDYAISYGIFDFDAPNFVYRFVKGETDYMVGIVPWEHFLDSYRRQHRRVEQQRLNLSPAQRQRLLDLLEENLRPENRVYRYNYVKDNCATRPMALIEKAVDAPVVLGPTRWDVWSLPVSFRDVMRHYHANYPWYQFGIDLALGSGIDYPLCSREYSFAPVDLAVQIAGARVGGRHIAGPAEVVADYPADAAVLPPTPWYLTPLAVCWFVFAILLVVTVRDCKARNVTRWVDAAYFGILGLCGLLLTFLIFVSVHEATSPNWLYFWLNPFCLIPTIFIWLKKCKKVVLWYQFINFAVVFLSLACWWWIPQSANAAFLPLVLGDLMRSGSYIRNEGCRRK